MKIVQLVAVLLVVLYVGQSLALEPKLYDRFHVEIVNRLSHGNLIFRCKSKNDVIGAIVLDRGKSYAFDFRINFWKTTLFFCDIWQGQLYRFHRVFDAFQSNSDFIDDVCGDDWCRWIAMDSGVYTYNTEKKQYVLKYLWELLPSAGIADEKSETSPAMSPLTS